MIKDPCLINIPTPIITPRLILRPPQIGDAAALHAAILESFDLLTQWMPWAKEKPTPEESEIFIRQAAANWILKKNEEPYLPLFMFDKTTHDFVGATGFHHFDWDIPSIETGYWIRTSYMGQGLMTEAVRALTQFAFLQLHVKRMTITCDPDNIRSRKIPERLGYTLESVIKSNRVNARGEVSDTLVFTRLDLEGLN